MSPTLHNPVIKEVFEELLKKKPFESEYNNFLKVQSLFLSGKECLAAFIELLREVKTVTFYPYLSIELKNCTLTAANFPLGFWKKMVFYIPELIISKFNEAEHMPLIEAIEHSTKLCKVEACIDLKIEAWRYLLNTSVKEIAATLRSLIDIGTLDEHLYDKIQSVEAFINKDIHIADPEYNALDEHLDFNVESIKISNKKARELLQDFLINYRIPCKSLKILWDNSWTSFLETIVTNVDTAALPVVEKLVLKVSDIEEITQVSQLNLTQILEALQRIFPNLKELEMELKIDDNERDCFGSISFFGLFVVDGLTSQVEKADISYKLSFNYCRINYIDWEHDNVLQMENDFTRLNFVADKKSDIEQKWVHSNQLSDIKDLKITFLLDDVEMNSEFYDEMIDDLGLDDNYTDNYYTYGEDEIDYDAFDDAGFDFDDY
uniref:Uncharacterized protein n=1 Tax=Panagrolaimus sp. ES5 TaxID=591445 RepID=A0AC34F3Q5_9BILA